MAAGAVDFGGGPSPQAEGRAFVVKLQPDGGHMWSRRFGYGDGLGNQVNAIRNGSDGRILVAADVSVRQELDGVVLEPGGVLLQLSP